jgi:hypothetical protein
VPAATFITAQQPLRHSPKLQPSTEQVSGRHWSSESHGEDPGEHVTPELLDDDEVIEDEPDDVAPADEETHENKPDEDAPEDDDAMLPPRS